MKIPFIPTSLNIWLIIPNYFYFMNRKRIRETFVLATTLILTVLWVYAAVIKLADYETFRTQLSQSPMLSRISGTAAWLIPVTELVLAGCVNLGRTRLIGLLASLGLLTAFTAYIILTARFSYHVPCACGGIIESLGWTGHLALNIGIGLLAFLAVLAHTDQATKHYIPDVPG